MGGDLDRESSNVFEPGGWSHAGSNSTHTTIFGRAVLAPIRSSACLVVIQGEGLGDRIDIGDEPVIVGRSPEADLRIRDKTVSRQHCEIWRDGACYRIRHIGSTNPTLVNGRSVQSHDLTDGDLIVVGICSLKFVDRHNIEAHYHEKLHRDATRDPLTGLYNLRHFAALADREISRSVQRNQPLTMCLLDLDYFKKINDTYGHPAGDDILRHLGFVLRQHTRGGDFCARIGGEEFGILFRDCATSVAAVAVERLRFLLASRGIQVGDSEVQVTISGGLAGIKTPRENYRTLLKAADDALYQSKRNGRNRITVAP
jgi:diguanylate cyclase (GGDEF)-like protein